MAILVLSSSSASRNFSQGWLHTRTISRLLPNSNVKIYIIPLTTWVRHYTSIASPYLPTFSLTL